MTTTDIIEQDIDWTYNLEFAKIGGIDSDVLYVAGEASNALKDHDNENMDMDSLKSAFVDYMKNPIIKFMHDKAPQHIGAIGLVVEKYTDSAGKLWETKFGKTPFLVAKFEKDTMPPWMWKAIQKKLYKGFSIGGKAFKKVKGTIYVKSWLETSVVDVPSATGAFFTVLKSACESGNCPYEKGGKGSGQKGHRTTKQINDKETAISAVESIIDKVIPKNLQDKDSDITTKFESFKNVDLISSYIPTNDRESGDSKKFDVKMESKWNSKMSSIKSSLSKAGFKNVRVNLDVGEKGRAGLKIAKSTISMPSLDKFLYDKGEKHMQIEKFIEAADNYLKGGPGSGQKGHKTAKKMPTFKDFLGGDEEEIEYWIGDSVENIRTPSDVKEALGTIQETLDEGGLESDEEGQLYDAQDSLMSYADEMKKHSKK